MKRWTRILLITVAVIAGLGAFGFVAIQLLASPSFVTVHNSSGTEITNVVIAGNGFSEHIKIIKPGESVTLPFQAKGETGVAVAFDARGRHVSAAQQDYASSGGYKCSVEIGPELAVSVRCRL